MTQAQDTKSDEVLDAEHKELTVVIKPDSSQFLPALTLDEATERYELMKKFISNQLIEGTDYGKIPGTKKTTLYKPGAEKLTTFFGLRVLFVDDGSIERFEGDDPFFYYKRKCQLWKGDVLIAEASGSANSKEGRYRWRWVKKEELPDSYSATELAELKKRGGTEGIFRWQYEKRTTSGQYAKPESYWQAIDKMLESGERNIQEVEREQPWGDKELAWHIEWESYEYRIPNDDIYTLVNTILKMAEKRSLTAATLIACNASDYFTQDMEDIQEHIGVEVEGTPPTMDQPEQLDVDVVIANSLAAIKEGTFAPNDYISLYKALDMDQGYAMEVKKKHEQYDGKKLVKTDFASAAKELIEQHEKVNG
jgi:hypothetical protein